jgi:hypothetical protein
MAIGVLAAVACWCPATASALDVHISGTGSQGLFLRPTPNASGTPLAVIPEGTTLAPDCFVYGQTINTVPIWWRLTYEGATGYASSAYDDTRYSSDAELTAKYGVPRCDVNPNAAGGPSSTTSSPPSAPAPATPPPPSAHERDCGYSDGNVRSIVTTYQADGTFNVHVSPTELARAVGTGERIVGREYVVYQMWHAVQHCVPGLYGHLADSIYQQLQCHVWLGIDSASRVGTGPTYDLESWHLPLVDPGLKTYAASHCLNNDAGDRVVPENAETG